MALIEQLVKKKINTMDRKELAHYLKKISDICRIIGLEKSQVSEIKHVLYEGGFEALRKKYPRWAHYKRFFPGETVAAVLEESDKNPGFGQKRIAEELNKRGISITASAVRTIWTKHGLETTEKRLARLKEKVFNEGLVLTSTQKEELLKHEKNHGPGLDSIYSTYPGFMLGQDTLVVGKMRNLINIVQQTVIDSYSGLAFVKLYHHKGPLEAVDFLNQDVLPFFKSKNITVERIYTDRGREYSGLSGNHPYDVFLEIEGIQHIRAGGTKTQLNDICESFHKMVFNEFYRKVFRKKSFQKLADLQQDLDQWVQVYNSTWAQQGKRCQGRTPLATFQSARPSLIPS